MRGARAREPGARVVVNDLGTRGDGRGRDESGRARGRGGDPKQGGEAVPHFGDVADWNDAQALIETAIERFGDLHILVNNAGFLRDSMIFNMSEEEFDAVIRVHLKGHFCAMRFATAYWREQGQGQRAAGLRPPDQHRSEAFIFGSPGQPNYAAAKAGIVAMTMSARAGAARSTASRRTRSCRARARA